jgi:uncharacterized protein YutE (UPF0331/DUF86 family)
LAIDSQVIKARLRRLEKCLKKLTALAATKYEDFAADEDLQDRAERNFQVAIECCLDIGTHIIAALNLGDLLAYADVFRILGEKEILPRDFAEKIEKMAGFRNVLVHDYLEIDTKKVHHYLQQLDDFRKFAGYILDFLEERGEI